MKAFENIEIACVPVPTRREVLDRIRRDEPCQANPLSTHCTFAQGRDAYLIEDVAGSEVCQRCPLFDEKRRKLVADWTEWVLAMQDVYT